MQNAQLQDVVQRLTGRPGQQSNIHVTTSTAYSNDLARMGVGRPDWLRGTQAFFERFSGRTVLFADRIADNEAAAVLAHELVHKSARKLLPPSEWTGLINTIGTWEGRAKTTPEWLVFTRATARAKYGTARRPELFEEELFAYAVEEGVKLVNAERSLSRADEDLGGWLLRAERALHKIARLSQPNIDPGSAGPDATDATPEEDLTVDDLVALAFALARIDEVPLKRHTPVTGAADALDKASFSRSQYLRDKLAATAAAEAAVAELELASLRPGITTGQSLGLYSALARGLEALPIKEAAPASWKEQIKGLINKGQVKQDEVEWTSLFDWLDLQDGKVSKDSVSDYLEANGVQVNEVVFAGDGKDWPVKYDTYTLPGGQNYREVLLTLPPAKRKERFDVVSRSDKSILFKASSQAEAAQWIERHQGMPAAKKAEIIERPNGPAEEYEFKTTHWDQSNVIAHIRLNERADADGKRILFIEEIQSDWAQQGKKKGFSTTGWMAPYAAWEKAARERAKTYYLDAADTDEERAVAIRMGERLSRREDLGSLATILGERPLMSAAWNESMRLKEQVQAGPFVTKTDGWLNLALKRVMVMAVEGGFDAVAFINGEQSVERFSLHRNIQLLGYDPEKGRLDAFDANLQSIFTKMNVKPEDIENHVGKEVAKKLLETKKSRGKHILEGTDIQAGGSGMKVFYDQIVPAAVNKLLAKLGGGKMSTVVVGKTHPYRAIQSDADGGGEVVDLAHKTVSFHPSVAEARDEADRLNAAALREEEKPLLDEIAAAEHDGASFDDLSDRAQAQVRYIAQTKSQTAVLRQPSFSITDAMREKIGASGLPLFSRVEQDYMKLLAQQQAYLSDPIAYYKQRLAVIEADLDRLFDIGVTFSRNGRDVTFYLSEGGTTESVQDLPEAAQKLAQKYIEIDEEWSDAECGNPPAFMRAYYEAEQALEDEPEPLTDHQKVVNLLMDGLWGRLPQGEDGPEEDTDPNGPDIVRSVQESTLGLYSSLQRALSDSPTQKAAAGDWKNLIRGMQQKGLVKASEIQWLGLDDWLSVQTGKVTKEALLGHIAAHGLALTELVLREPRAPGEYVAKPRYGKYTLDGGENYREVLLCAPVREADNLNDIALKLYGVRFSELDDEPANRVVSEELRQHKERNYRSRHWSEANVVVHLRLNDRLDADGRRVLFVEEIQSDWGQKGKKNGFRKPGETAWDRFVAQGYSIYEEDNGACTVWSILDHNGDLVSQEFTREKAIQDLIDRDQNTGEHMVPGGGSETGGVPVGPFVTSTDAWLNLGLKRVMALAIEGGYHSVAFVNGKQSADRYQLSQEIEEIQYENKDGKAYILALDKDCKQVINQTIPHSQLAEHVGKELAEKIIDGGPSGRLQDADLVIGGEGIQTFYDQIVPNAAKKLLVKAGAIEGARLQNIPLIHNPKGWTITPPSHTVSGRWMVKSRDYTSQGEHYDTEQEAQKALASKLDRLEQPGFVVTDAMRETLAEGQPMFSQASQAAAGDGFYSSLVQELEAAPTRAAPVAGWRTLLKGLVSKGRVKQDEITWSGLDDWLQLQERSAAQKLPKEALLNYLAEHQVRVQTIELGGPDENTQKVELQDKRDAAAEVVFSSSVTVNGKNVAIDDLAYGLLDETIPVESLPADRQGAAREWLQTYRALVNFKASVYPATKYEKYAVPDAENYREVLIKLPKLAPRFRPITTTKTLEIFKTQMLEKYGVEDFPQACRKMNGNELERMDWLYKDLQQTNQNGSLIQSRIDTFNSPHWAQENILVHLRLSERRSTDSQRILFIEEIQSDWGQKGKAEGFGDEDAKKQILAEVRRYDLLQAESAALEKQLVGDRHPINQLVADRQRDQTALTSRIEDLQRQMEDCSAKMHDLRSPLMIKSTPTGPFVGNTEAWVSLGLKRAITLAVEGGYDGVALVRGEQSAEALKIQKQVGGIYYTPDGVGKGTLLAMPLGADLHSDEKPVIEVDDVGPEDLERYIGKELSRRLLEDEPRFDGFYALEGDGLKVGDAGLKSFYNDLVPKIMKRLLPKVGGTAPERMVLKGMDGGEEGQIGFPITDRMREQAAMGLPLFSLKGAEVTPAPGSWQKGAARWMEQHQVQDPSDVDEDDWNDEPALRYGSA